MPEGDTIHKVALYLRPRLVGETLQAPEQSFAPNIATLAGDRVVSIEAIGKHLVVTTDARILRVHLGMRGTWHHYRPRERWKIRASQAKVVLTAKCGVLVCFRAPQVTLARRSSTGDSSIVSRLGPDLLADSVDCAAIVQRARDYAQQSPLVMDMLLDQQVACGIGNAFKSEILFLERILPTVHVDALDDNQLERLYRRARKLMVPNLGGGPRTTTVDISKRSRPVGLPRYWVYGRRNQPCLVCGDSILRDINGRHSRVTYWCEQCQSSHPVH